MSFSRVYIVFVFTIACSWQGSALEQPNAQKSQPTETKAFQQFKNQNETSEDQQSFPEIDDIVYGSPEAKVALVEYSSVNCTHCAAFRKAFRDPFKKAFLDTNKVQVILKHFPLDYTAVEYMSLIVKQPKDKWLDLFEKALATQPEWLGKKPEVLAQVLGISEQDCKVALGCQTTKQLVMAKRFNAEQVVEINATPSFLIIYRQNKDLKFELINEGITPDELLAKLDKIYKSIT